MNGRLWLSTVLLVAMALAGCISDDTEPDSEGGPTTAPSGAPDPTPEGPADPDPPAENGTPEPPGPASNGTTQAWIWPDLSDAKIRPGVQMVADGSQCTSNFVFLDPGNTTVYLGFAAHCVGEGSDSTNTDGCDAGNPSLPLGTKVEVEGASKPATLVYSSWETMQRIGEAGGGACAHNDFAVVALHPDDAGKAHPAMLGFGGPTGRSDGAVGLGDKVLTFGNTGLRPGPTDLDAREGYVLFDDAWTTTAYTATPGLPGDSGSGVLTADGEALGVLVTVALAPYSGSNGITDLGKAMEYAAVHGGLDLELGTWEVLDPGRLP